jgi:3-phosphoshikimate 1-carboxyvinyltransferase
MAATVAAFACKEKTVIKGAQAVNKSYPTFFEDISKLGGVTNVI